MIYDCAYWPLGRTEITASVVVAVCKNGTTLNFDTLAEGLYFLWVDVRDTEQLTVQ